MSAVRCFMHQRQHVPGLQAHFFVFYFAIVSNITPPVALAAYAASSIAGSSPNKTGFTAMRLGILAFIVPFSWLLVADSSPVPAALRTALFVPFVVCRRSCNECACSWTVP